MTCSICKRESAPDVYATVCADCRSPEKLRDDLEAMSSPLADVMLRVGRDMGIVAPPEGE